MSIVLLGGGGHASDVLCVIEALANAAGPDHHDLDGPVFIADDAWQFPERFEDRGIEVKLVESIEAGIHLGCHVSAVGFPRGRQTVAELAAQAGGIAAAPLFHPDASIGAGVIADDGVVVMGQTWVSAKVELGQHTHVGYGATVGHDSQLGSWCSVMPGACIGGDVVIEDGVLVGANATVMQGVTIGEGAQIGAGATVINDVRPGLTVVGTPAVPPRKRAS